MTLQLNLATLPDGRKAAIIRTSDRIAFKQCRRKWGWSSHLLYNLGPKQLAAPLWFGSAIHYALEDYHGYNVFGHPAEAFKAYCIATAHNHNRDLPPDAQEHYEMGKAMMNYYVKYWLKGYGRKADTTYWHEGIPQVEVNFEIPIPIDESRNPLLHSYCLRHGVDIVLYRGTIDRISIDEFGHLWVVEYKTAKVAAQQHYQTDPQCTTYVWAASLIYDKPVAGVVYQQFIKKTPVPPKVLSTGRLSTAQNQTTSYPLYEEQLLNLYGEVKKAPSLNVAYMNQLMTSENADRDRYIIRDRVFRNAQQCKSEEWKILMELEDILNPDLALYPNPTRDCSRMCSFLTPCVNMDDGSDWEALLRDNYSSRDTDMERFWRQRLPNAQELFDQTHTPEGLLAEPDLLNLQAHVAKTSQEIEQYRAAQIAAGDYPAADWETQDPNPYAGVNEKGEFNMSAVEV